MSAPTEIGEHDLAHITGASRLGVWAECECSWISRGMYSEQAARIAHERHAAAHAAEGDRTSPDSSTDADG